MKLKTINPHKYNVRSKTEIKDQLLRRDTKESQEKVEASELESRVIRMGTTAAAALLTGILYQKKPSLWSLMGTPVSLDRLMALGGSAVAFMTEDEQVAQAAEGNTGLVPLLRDVDHKVGGPSLA